nr:MAG TPA: hypothetical protein [Caudoviricetes sp.]
MFYSDNLVILLIWRFYYGNIILETDIRAD